MRKMLQIGNGVALVVTVVISYISNAGLINGKTIGEVSARYENLFTPAGYAFSIWGVIYVGLLVFVIYQARNAANRHGQHPADAVGVWFILSCVANSLWVLTWLYEWTGVSVLIMSLLLVCLLRVLARLRHATRSQRTFVWLPFSVYAGWVTVALVANAAAWLTGTGWDAFGLSASVWAVVMLGVAIAINLLMVWSRNNYPFAFAGIWGVVAIGMNNWVRAEVIAVTALIGATIILLGSVLHLFTMPRGRSETVL